MIWLKRLWNISFWVLAILAFLLFVLSLMGGNSDALKKGMEDFLSESTSSKVRIETLNHVGFYPALVFDFANMTGVAGEEAEKVDVFSVGYVRLGMGFWDMTLNKGRLRDVMVKDIYMAPGIWSDEIVNINELALKPNADVKTGGALMTEGLIGDKAFSALLPMAYQKSRTGRDLYSFIDDKYVDFTLGGSAARLRFSEKPFVLEPVKRGDDYCDLVQLLLAMDIEFSHNCALEKPVEE